MNKTQENHPQKARPRTHSDRRNSLSKSVQNRPSFHKTDTTRLLNGLRSTKPRNFRSKNPGMRLHVPPQASDDPRPNPSNLCKSAHDFGKLTIPWCSTALDQQNPRISRPKKKARPYTRRQRIRRRGLQSHAPIRTASARTCHTCHTCHTCRTCHSCHTHPQHYDVMDDVIHC